MLKKPRGLHLLAILAIVAILSLLAWDKYRQWQDRRRHELRVNSFDESKVVPVVLPGVRIVENGSLAGRWVKTVGLEWHSELIFEAPVEGGDRSYRVEFTTHAGTSSHRDRRTAEYSNGQVTLDRPVADTIGPVYRRLHCARVGNKRILVPETRSDKTAELHAAIRLAEKDDKWRDLEAIAYVYDGGS